ncbi:MAG: hypothetical protein AABX35_03950 [Nanoarchaeota archaeon]
MGKKKEIDMLTTFIADALRHRIGALLGLDKKYFRKYIFEYQERMNLAKKVIQKNHFNSYDETIIKEKVIHKLNNELASREYIDNKKFDIMDEEIEKALKELELD